MGPELLFIMAALGLLGTGMNVTGELFAGDAEAREAERNKLIAEKAARDVERQGVNDQQLVRRAGRRYASEQRTAYAAGGVDLGSSTVQAHAAGTGTLVQEDVDAIALNAAREAWGYRSKAQEFESKAKLARSRGPQRAVGSLLTSGVQMLGAFKGA